MQLPFNKKTISTHTHMEIDKGYETDRFNKAAKHPTVNFTFTAILILICRT